MHNGGLEQCKNWFQFLALERKIYLIKTYGEESRNLFSLDSLISAKKLNRNFILQSNYFNWGKHELQRKTLSCSKLPQMFQSFIW